MTGDELAETYVNGNISETRRRLRRANRRLVLDFIDALVERGYRYPDAIARTRGLLP